MFIRPGVHKCQPFPTHSTPISFKLETTSGKINLIGPWPTAGPNKLNYMIAEATLQAALRCGAPRRLSFTAPHFFGVALWLITMARRVTCRNKNPSMHRPNQHPQKLDFQVPRCS